MLLQLEKYFRKHTFAQEASNLIIFFLKISALDSNRTEIGYIRREIYNLVRTYFTNADAYGISFPPDLDVRVKAIFLGALFLIVSHIKIVIYKDLKLH